MGNVALSGKDTIKINGRIFNDLVDGDCVMLTFANDITARKTGKNGNTIYAFNYTGEQVDVVMRVLRGSADDKFLNELLGVFKNDPPRFTLLNGEFVKTIGDGSGAVISDIYSMNGGVFSKNIDTKENAEGDTEQSVAVYSLYFSNAPRTIG